MLQAELCLLKHPLSLDSPLVEGSCGNGNRDFVVAGGQESWQEGVMCTEAESGALLGYGQQMPPGY